MPIDRSDAVVERSLREVVQHYLPQPSPSPPEAIDRSLWGWLRRWVLPRLLIALVVSLLVAALVLAFGAAFAPGQVCQVIDRPDPFGIKDLVEVCYPEGTGN